MPSDQVQVTVTTTDGNYYDLTADQLRPIGGGPIPADVATAASVLDDRLSKERAIQFLAEGDHADPAVVVLIPASAVVKIEVSGPNPAGPSVHVN